jgi:TPR repeat protein
MTNITTRAWLTVGIIGLMVATCASFGPPASAAGTAVQELNDGLSAYVREEPLQAFQILLPLAEKGEPLAQLIVGRLYKIGNGAPQDCGEAVKWFTRAAEQGNVEAQFELGTFYHQGQCVAKNDRTAVSWFERSGEKGDPRGLTTIGEIYLGHGDIPQDYAKAIDWFLRGAKLFDAEALYKLGILHSLGQGAPKDDLEAYKWFDLSAGFAYSGEDKDKAIRARDSIREDMTPAQVAEAAQRSENWLLALLKKRPAEKQYGQK